MTNIASMIDHTLLAADANKDDIIKICKEAKDYKFKAVCVNPYYIETCKDELKNTDVKVATVIGFPLGSNTKESKSFEAKDAIDKGADEVDMVINIAALKSGNYEYVLEDIKSVVDTVKGKAKVKVIIETCLLSHDEKIKACELAMEAGADFVKTSTGFSTGGATIEDVKLMKSVVGEKLEIKASGGIRNKKVALDMIEAGASRLGASSGVEIVTE